MFILPSKRYIVSAAANQREIIAVIQHQIPISWDEPTVDTFKAGNPDAPVNGIAVTMMATMDVLQRAAARGDNLIITHEPTFFDHLDTPRGIKEDDAVWKEKRAFIEQHISIHELIRCRTSACRGKIHSRLSVIVTARRRLTLLTFHSSSLY
jgi:hypothetical protein